MGIDYIKQTILHTWSVGERHHNWSVYGRFFALPKGLTVRNASERGLSAIGQFENERFQIVISSDDELINYDLPIDSLGQNGNYYSADFDKYTNEKEE